MGKYIESLKASPTEDNLKMLYREKQNVERIIKELNDTFLFNQENGFYSKIRKNSENIENRKNYLNEVKSAISEVEEKIGKEISDNLQN